MIKIYNRLQDSWKGVEYLVFCWSPKERDEDPGITRFDYRFDLFYKEVTAFPKVEDIFQWNINKNSNVDRKWKGLDGLSWRSIWSKITKRYFVRCYDKKLDICDKNKFALYWDYQDYESIHRFEIQFWPNFTRWFSLSTLWQLVEKCRSLMGRTYEFDWLMFYKYNSVTDVTQRNKLRLTKIFTSVGVKFTNAGINPYEVLFHNLKERQVEDWTDKTNKEIYVWQHKVYLKDFQQFLIDYLS